MSAEDRVRWDQRHFAADTATDMIGLSAAFAPFADVFPVTGQGLDVACGRGQVAVWLARRGVDVLGLDVSPAAIDRATALARTHGVAGRCHFQVTDLDDGLPPGSPANIVVCQRFRDTDLDQAVIGRLAPGGLLAMSALSEVGAKPGPFRVEAGELQRAFAALEVIACGEGDGEAWLLARHRSH